MKHYFIILVMLFLLTTACNNAPKTDDIAKDQVAETPKTINILYHFSQTSDSHFCNKDSIIGGDCGFGELYLTADGSALYNDFCMGQENTTYMIGNYVLTDTSIACTFNKVYQYYDCSNCTDEEQKKPVDPNSGKITETNSWTLVLKKLKCPDFEYYTPPTDEELEQSKKDQEDARKGKYEMSIFRGYVFSKADNDRSSRFFEALSKIKALSSFHQDKKN